MNPKRWMSVLLAAAAFGVAAPAFSDEGAVKTSKGPEADAEAYMAVWADKGKERCESNDPGCAAAGHALEKAAAAYVLAGQRNKAIAVRKTILDPKNHLDYTDYGRRAAFDLAQDYQAIAEYAEAASLFESAAKKFPAMDRAPEALSDAVVLRLGLGDVTKAVENVDLFAKNFGAKQPATHAKMLLAIGAFHEEKGEFAEARKWLEKSMAKLDKAGEFDNRVVAHAMLGRVRVKLDDAKGAEKEYDVVRALWKDPEAGLKAILASGGSEETQDKRLGRTLTAVGEAHFFFAEQKRKAADEIRFPEFKGAATKEAVLEHINTKVVEWVRKKRPAIEEAEKEYLKIVSLQPMPPPRWVIASSARVGQMWGKFTAEFRAAPIPKEWKGKGKLPGTELTYESIRKDYYERLDEASEPQKQTAKAAFKKCVDYSTKFQWFDEYSRTCGVWLEKNYGKQFVHLEEFRPKSAGASFVVPAMPIAKDERTK
jgi:tetratricopeptide (TPR) repeat protein